MKNILFIDLDTERKPSIQIGKPNGVEKPTNPEEAKEMLLNDIFCACEGLCQLIHIADQNNYGIKEHLVNATTKILNGLLNNEPKQQG